MISRRLVLQSASAVLSVALAVVGGHLTNLIPAPPLPVAVALALLAAGAATAITVALEHDAPDAAAAPRDVIVLELPQGRHRTAHGIEVRPRLVVALLIGLLVGIGSGAALAVLRRPAESRPSGAFEVRTVTVTIDPPGAEAHCPAADFVFRGEIHTNGAAGTVVFMWVQPDGGTTPVRWVSVDAGASGVLQSLRFSFTGHNPESGAALLRVVQPRETSSEPAAVRYLCP